MFANKTVPHSHSDITLFEKTDQKVYLFDVSEQNSGNVQTAYTKKMRKFAQLSTEVKKHSQVEPVYTAPVSVSTAVVIPHTLHHFYSKTNKMHQCFKFILFWNDIVHVSDGPSVHHQEFKTTFSNRLMSNRYCCLLASKQSAVSVWLLYVQSLNS